MTTKHHILLLAAVLLGALNICAREFTLPVGQFSKVSVDDNVNVVYVGADGTPSRVTYEGEQKYANAFIITHKGNKLRIQVETMYVDDPELPTLYVYSDFLENASLSAESTLTLKAVAPGSNLDLSVMGNGSIVAENIRATKVGASIKSGNGTISVSGHCQAASFTMLGNGTIQADRLEAVTVNCKMLGQGSIGCWPTEELKVRGIGNTKIYYKGSPKIDKKGGGKLFPLESD
ncbi:MAG: DUF2807 domain-containing protein [Muribaculaceae bacterium]|nr:DUF2807 domain-containing protein [Muribaculaceae bacterium]